MNVFPLTGALVRFSPIDFLVIGKMNFDHSIMEYLRDLNTALGEKVGDFVEDGHLDSVDGVGDFGKIIWQWKTIAGCSTRFNVVSSRKYTEMNFFFIRLFNSKNLLNNRFDCHLH